MPAGESPSQVSKEVYAQKFPEKWKYYPKYMFSNPEVTIKGNMAEVKLNLESGGYFVDYKINMVNENGKWLIQETSFSY